MAVLRLAGALALALLIGACGGLAGSGQIQVVVSGVLVDADGRPLPNVEVRLTALDWAPMEVDGQTVGTGLSTAVFTDAEGRFAISLDPPSEDVGFDATAGSVDFELEAANDRSFTIAKYEFTRAHDSTVWLESTPDVRLIAVAH